jgi:hypothetical protein
MYDAIADPYCYPGTTVLKNIPDLRSQEDLDRFETAATGRRLLEPLPSGRLSVRHYRAIHHLGFPCGVEGSVRNPSPPGGRNGTETSPGTVHPRIQGPSGSAPDREGQAAGGHRRLRPSGGSRARLAFTRTCARRGTVRRDAGSSG